jgi:hypothetical protein
VTTVLNNQHKKISIIDIDLLKTTNTKKTVPPLYLKRRRPKKSQRGRLKRSAEAWLKISKP